jgi:hypothetical protein
VKPRSECPATAPLVGPMRPKGGARKLLALWELPLGHIPRL